MSSNSQTGSGNRHRWLAVPRLPERLDLARGLRGGLAIGASLAVCRWFDIPEGWVGLAAFYVVLADNGGPYRSRLKTLLTLLLGGSAAILLGALASGDLFRMIVVTVLVCFTGTYLRVVSQQVSSTSVLTLVVYFAMLSTHGQSTRTAGSTLLLWGAGWAWGASLSLFFWPLDPFRPARLAVGQCYRTLAAFAEDLSEGLSVVREDIDTTPDIAPSRTVEHHRQMRVALEAARTALRETRARAAVRTLRARNLTVLLEVADILFAATIRAAEIADQHEALLTAEERTQFLAWIRRIAEAYGDIAQALAVHPADDGLSFSQNGSHRLTYMRSLYAVPIRSPSPMLQFLAAEEREVQETLLLAFDALYAVWSGLERPLPERLRPRMEAEAETSLMRWSDALRANWTPRSVMMQHALRMAVVGGIDALLMRLLHVNHGFWLAMTSLIVLQPNVANTLKRSFQRVGGTVGGALLAALLAATLQSPPLLVAVITVLAALTCAFYAVDYGWYCFFLTPAFVLSSLPHVHDWRFAGVRVALTLLGTGTSLAAMRFLWPESERFALTGFFARCCAADAAYARGILTLWDQLDTPQEEVARQQLAAKRRACGLASNDAEECVDRVMLEPEALSRAPHEENHAHADAALAHSDRWQHELTFVTYIRRLTQSLLAFARLSHGEPEAVTRLDAMAARLEQLQSKLLSGAAFAPASVPEAKPDAEDVQHVQMRRLERQIAVLERAVSAIVEHGPQASSGSDARRL